MARVSLRDKLFVLTTLSGAAYFAAQLASAPVDFHTLSSAFPAVAPTFQEQQGFVSVLRWAESLHTPQGMDVLEPTHIRLAHAAAFETYVHASKTALQCGLLLFLYRLKALPRRWAVRTICLCVLVLLCWKMAQSCLQEILSSQQPQHVMRKTMSGVFAAEMHAAFLSMLFLLRFAATALVNAVLGYAYQRYFCAPWPASWCRVPRYLGSKDLVLSTLYYAAGAVAAMSISCAALQFECAALACSLLHFHSNSTASARSLLQTLEENDGAQVFATEATKDLLPRVHAEQQVCGQAIVNAVVGVEHLEVDMLTAENLAHVFCALLAPDVAERASSFAQTMAPPQDAAVTAFYANLPLAAMTCNLDPVRIARVYDSAHQQKLSDGSEDIKYKPIKYSLHHPPRVSL
ncbi:hypothetical protein PybrP1_012615 [[Pythium] brassicae (nom. inval.)]|nr:hypothetical protein PybrP1_012615 [[Pythium] brassicae (nom. inval.)]